MSSVKEDKIYIELAEYILFSGNRNFNCLEDKMNSLGLEYRKNKGPIDVNRTIAKVKNPRFGGGKTETEIEMMALYLKLDVIKKKKKYKIGDKVKIVDYPPNGSGFIPCNSPKDSEMGIWLGKIMTIKEVQERCYLMEEDYGRWAWTPLLIEKKI